MAFDESWVTFDSYRRIVYLDLVESNLYSSSKTTVEVYVKATMTQGINVIESISKVIMVACTVTTFTPPSVTNLKYIYDDGTLNDYTTESSTTIAPWAQLDGEGESCGFTETLTVTTLSWLTTTDRKVTLTPSGTENTEISTVTVTSNLDDGSTSGSTTFTATLLFRSCETLTLTPPVITPSIVTVDKFGFNNSIVYTDDGVAIDPVGKCGTFTFSASGFSDQELITAGNLHTFVIKPQTSTASNYDLTFTASSVEYAYATPPLTTSSILTVTVSDNFC